MSYEDLFYEIHEQMKNLGLRKQFDKELELLRNDPKWQYKEVRDRWSEAQHRTLKKKNENI